MLVGAIAGNRAPIGVTNTDITACYAKQGSAFAVGYGLSESGGVPGLAAEFVRVVACTQSTAIEVFAGTILPTVFDSFFIGNTVDFAPATASNIRLYDSYLTSSQVELQEEVGNVWKTVLDFATPDVDVSPLCVARLSESCTPGSPSFTPALIVSRPGQGIYSIFSFVFLLTFDF
jgi:hypothetical protein